MSSMNIWLIVWRTSISSFPCCTEEATIILFFKMFLLHFYLFVCLFDVCVNVCVCLSTCVRRAYGACVWCVCVCLCVFVSACVLWPTCDRGPLVEVSSLLPPYGPGDQTHVVMLGSRHLCALSHLASPILNFIATTFFLFFFVLLSESMPLNTIVYFSSACFWTMCLFIWIYIIYILI